MNALIHIGASKEAIAEARGAINDILASVVEETTKRKALKVLSALCSVNNTSISNSTFSGNMTEEHLA